MSVNSSGRAAIRDSLEGDAAAIRAVHLGAFPTSAEADLVERLAADGDSVLSLVADEDGKIVGHVLLSRMRVSGDGRDYRALGLAPVAVAVAESRQGAGLGSLLIREALERASRLGEEIVFLLGSPAYYQRLGFQALEAAPFASPYAGPHFMALRLSDVALPKSGRAEYAPAFVRLESGS